MEVIFRSLTSNYWSLAETVACYDPPFPFGLIIAEERGDLLSNTLSQSQRTQVAGLEVAASPVYQLGRVGRIATGIL